MVFSLIWCAFGDESDMVIKVHVEPDEIVW